MQSRLGNGAVTSFLTLYFAVSGWNHGALAFTMFAVALIAGRMLWSGLPDRFGGEGGFVLSDNSGYRIGHDRHRTLAGAGDHRSSDFRHRLFTGISKPWPRSGKASTCRKPRLAMGTYNAFLDLTLGFGSPALGCSIFIGSAVAALLAVPIALRLL